MNKNQSYELPPAPSLTTWLMAAMLPLALLVNYVPESDWFVGLFVLAGGFIAIRQIAVWGWARFKEVARR